VSRNLDLVTRVPCHVDQFVIQGDRLYGSARYGDAYEATIVDLADVTAPRVVSTLRCRRQTPSVAVAGNVMFVAEYQRSILIVDVENPAKPTPFDAIVAFNRELTHFQIVDGVLVAAAGDHGVFALDVRDPRHVRALPALAIPAEESHVEHLTMRDGLIYAAAREAGLAIVEVADGKLRERGRITPEGFRVDHVLATEKCLWLFGSSDDDEATLVVVDRASGAVRYRGKTHISKPHNVLDIPGGGLGFHQHYTVSKLDDTDARIRRVFQQFEYDDDKSYVEIPMVPKPEGDDDNDGGDGGDGDEDGSGEDDDGLVPAYEGVDNERRKSCFDTADWVVRHGEHVIAAHERKELVIWKPRPGSVFG
jgi:hypothetical protein